MKHIFLYVVCVSCALAACSSVQAPSGQVTVRNFEECVAAGNAVLKSQPPQCRAQDGRVYTGIPGYSDKILAQNKISPIRSFEECVAAGYPILKTKPPRCVTSENIAFIEGAVEGANDTKKICKDLCGDGICQSIVCLGAGCPCPETQGNCAKDCQS